MIHPSKELIAGGELHGKRIALCLTGSVAVMKAPELARELMRRGAEVFVVMSKDACELLTPAMMYWATGNPVTSQLTGALEHIRLAGYVDLVLIAPATANTIGKIASGIDDSTVTVLAMSAIGKKPILIAPAMHEEMYHQIVKKNVEKLKGVGVQFVEPMNEEGKAKMADVDEIVDYVVKGVTKQSLKGKKVVVTAGATREWMDDVRFISNPSSGRMGIALGREAWLRGADVAMVLGHIYVEVPPYLKRIVGETVEAMHETVKKETRDADVVVLAAAAGDFKTMKVKGKISSEKELKLILQPSLKISGDVRKVNKKCKLILFKAESGVNGKELMEKARRKMKEAGADMVVANDVAKRGAGFGSETNDVVVITGKGASWIKSTKAQIARKIFDLI